MIRLNLGCGILVKKGWVNVDKHYTLEQLKGRQGIFVHARVDKGAQYIQADILKLPFKNNYADYAELDNVLEHLSIYEVPKALVEIRRVLKKGGKLAISTPNFTELCREWLEMMAMKPFNIDHYVYVSEAIYGNQMAEGEVHRAPITPEFMNTVLQTIGFKKFKMVGYRRGGPMPPMKAVPINPQARCRNDTLYILITK